MKFKISNCTAMKPCVNIILSAVMTKPVQLEYSAVGKVQKRYSKKNFSKTPVFECMSGKYLTYVHQCGNFNDNVNNFISFTDILTEKFASTPAEIVGATSRWLSGAIDRDGGKKVRDKEAQGRN